MWLPRALPLLLLAHCALVPARPDDVALSTMEGGQAKPRVAGSGDGSPQISAKEMLIDAVPETPPPEVAWPRCCAPPRAGIDPGKPLTSGRIRCILRESPTPVAVLRWRPAQPPGDEQRIDLVPDPSEFALPLMLQSQALPPDARSLRWKLGHAGLLRWRVRTRYQGEWFVSPDSSLMAESCPQLDEAGPSRGKRGP